MRIHQRNFLDTYNLKRNSVRHTKIFFFDVEVERVDTDDEIYVNQNPEQLNYYFIKWGGIIEQQIY
jgi:hypothetical protein